jgi:predicted outer membrane repeat protein
MYTFLAICFLAPCSSLSPLSPGDQGSAISLRPGACWSFASVLNSTFANNSGLRGGAIHAAGAPSACNTEEQSGISNNNTNLQTWISGSVFTDNTAAEDGGALYFNQTGDNFLDAESYLHLHNVTMKGNKVRLRHIYIKTG